MFCFEIYNCESHMILLPKRIRLVGEFKHVILFENVGISWRIRWMCHFEGPLTESPFSGHLCSKQLTCLTRMFCPYDRNPILYLYHEKESQKNALHFTQFHPDLAVLEIWISERNGLKLIRTWIHWDPLTSRRNIANWKMALIENDGDVPLGTLLRKN